MRVNYKLRECKVQVNIFKMSIQNWEQEISCSQFIAMLFHRVVSYFFILLTGINPVFSTFLSWNSALKI